MILPFLNGESTIQVFSGIPWDNTYKDMVRFEDKAAQERYFSSRPRLFNFTEYSPVREFPGTFKVDAPADDLYTANYCRWKNKGRWWYGFITSVQYINPSVSQITIELDVMQSYWFDWDFGDCLIEREHVASDQYTDNLTPETMTSPADYTADWEERLTPVRQGINEYCLMVESTEDLRQVNEPQWQATIRGNEGTAYQTYAPGKIAGFSGTGAYRATWLTAIFVEGSYGATAQAIFAALPLALASTLKTDTVLSMTMVPRALIGWEGSQSFEVPSIPLGTGTLDGYTPINKKLYHAPFTYLRMFSPSGGSVDFEGEYLRNKVFSAVTRINGSDSGITIFPSSYRSAKPLGMSAGVSCLCTGFTPVSFVTDTYRAFLAQRMYSNDNTLFAMSQAQTGLSTVAGVVGNLMTGNIGGAISSGLSGAADLARSQLSRKGEENLAIQKPDQLRGSTAAGNAASMVNRNWPYILRVCWPSWALRQADEYLTKYGYRVNRTGKPLTHSRRRFNYIETRDCVIKPGASVPADALAQIKGIINAGITLWHDAAYIGDYATDNPII